MSACTSYSRVEERWDASCSSGNNYAPVTLQGETPHLNIPAKSFPPTYFLGGSDAAECAFDAPESKPFGPCQASDTYPLFCTAAEAEAMSPSNGHHMMAGLFMPNGVDPMCHGNYVGDATACECEDATKNDDGSDGALAMTLGYGAIAAAALLA